MTDTAATSVLGAMGRGCWGLNAEVAGTGVILAPASRAGKLAYFRFCSQGLRPATVLLSFRGLNTRSHLINGSAHAEMSRWSNGHTVLLRRSNHTWRNHTWEDMLQ
jgi:hypothetical protein